ncbi:hypothetical protein HZU77_004255 [Neisseriaceae bacterium TC5R-5]|nr:hypothetical protein [Neisseriaceae bacterium TC5R-5]
MFTALSKNPAEAGFIDTFVQYQPISDGQSEKLSTTNGKTP